MLVGLNSNSASVLAINVERALEVISKGLVFVADYITWPPFGLMTWPTMKFAFSEAKYAIKDAISHGLPNSPIGDLR